MSQLEESVTQIESAVDLGSYGTSPGFVGWFEKKKGLPSEGAAESAWGHFCDYLGDKLLDLIIVTSILADSDEVGRGEDQEGNQRDRSIVRALVDARVVREISSSKEFGDDDGSDRFQSLVRDSRRHFAAYRLRDIGVSCARDLFLTRMLIDGTYGHCFAILQEKGLAFYSHDDQGFGIVCLNSSADIVWARRFLQKAGRREGFESRIR